MARSMRKAWNNGGKDAAANDEELQKSAREIVTARNAAEIKNLVHLQGLEIKHLEGERVWLQKEKARDVSPFNLKEIAAINQRYDRRHHELERRHNTFLGKVSRVFGGHKRQQMQVRKLTAERDREVGNRTKQHVDREGQRQRSLTERDVRVERDMQEARERHSQDRDGLREKREQGFDVSVKQEVQRLRMRGPKMEM